MKTFSKRVLFVAALCFLTFVVKAQTWNIPPASASSSSFIGTTSASDVLIRTGNSDRLKIFGSGNSLGSTQLLNGNLIVGSSGSGTINWPNAGNLYFRTLSNSSDISTSTTHMTILNDGRVGIGTSNIQSDTRLKIYHTQFPMMRIATPYNSSEASLFFAMAPFDTYYSNSAVAGDAVIGTGGACRSLIIQNSFNSQPIKFVTNYGNWQGVRMTINGDGRVGIGTSNFVGNYLLYVGGKIVCEEVKVKLQGNWPDYIFSKTHSLMPLDSVETFIKENNHLPNVPSAEEVQANGLETGEMFKIQMQKIEELTLYMIELKKQYAKVQEENEVLKKRIEGLENR